MPHPLKHIGAIDTAGSDTDQQLTGTRLRHGALTQAQDLGSTKGSDLDSTHIAIHGTVNF